ncbi:hypothetical protein ELI13_02745 [Rhizobium ruizarguesonis]|uniref:hypothetical protein n=1 Tax=Rhizobium ruizarguesonis TaxID=2081791 RepID=UPI00102FD2DB|nr:hypothetical protein [Rhizobium ruizarguesonis]TAW87746.1 hypothetical protein ELI13_02745 [Rhizobium ruizarguesonis]
MFANLGNNYASMNAEIDLANMHPRRVGYQRSTGSVCSAQRSTGEGSGNLADAYHSDGLHLNCAGDDIRCAEIKVVLQALGVI